MRSQEETSDDEWTYKNLENDSMDTDACSPEMLTKNDHSDTVIGSSEDLRNLSKKVLDSVKLEPDSIQRLVDQADELVHTTPKKTNSRKKVSPSTSQKVRHNEQVREWLRKCHQNGDYSTVGRFSRANIAVMMCNFLLILVKQNFVEYKIVCIVS